MAKDEARYSRGKTWRQFAVGDAAGSPLADWAYYSPDDLRGSITVEALKVASREHQFATAFRWFGANYKPCTLGPGPYFGFDGGEPQPGTLNSSLLNTMPVGGSASPRLGGFDQAPFAPPRVTAAVALHFEFGGMIPDEVLTELASRLPGDWTEIAASLKLDNLGNPSGSIQELSAAVSRGLDELSEALGYLGPVYGESGHNSGAFDYPFTVTERADLVRAIERAKQAISANPAPEVLAAISTDLRPVPKRINEWLAEKGDLFVTEAVKSLGKEAGKVLWALLAIGVAQELMTLLAQWHNLIH